MPDHFVLMKKNDSIGTQSKLKPTSRKPCNNHLSTIVPDLSIQKEYPPLASQLILDTSFSPNTQPTSDSSATSNLNEQHIQLNDNNCFQSCNFTPMKSVVSSQRMTRSLYRATVTKDQNKEVECICLQILLPIIKGQTPTAEPKIKKKTTRMNAPYQEMINDLSKQSHFYTPEVIQRAYSVTTSSNASPMLSTFSNISLIRPIAVTATNTVTTNPPTPIAAGSNKVYYGINDRMSKDIIELEQKNKKQPHSEGSTLVEDCNDDDYGSLMKPYSKLFELGPSPNRRDLNDFGQDDCLSDDIDSNNSNTSTPNTTFAELLPFTTSLTFEKCNDNSLFDSYSNSSPISQIIKEYAQINLKQEIPAKLTFERRTRSKMAVISELPMEIQSKYELQDTEVVQSTFLDQIEALEESMTTSLKKLSETNIIKLNAISESEANLINAKVMKESNLTNSIHQPKVAAFHDVKPYTFMQEQRKYQYQGVDAMIVMLGWHSTWTRYLVPKIDEFYQLSKYAAERSDVVVGYRVMGKRMHPYADLGFDENVDAWCMDGERIFIGYALGISVKSGVDWIKLGPGNVSVFKKDDILWMCSLGRSKFKPWASSEAPELKAMGRVFSCSIQESHGVIQSINVDLGREFCLEMTAKDIDVLKTLLL